MDSNGEKNVGTTITAVVSAIKYAAPHFSKSATMHTIYSKTKFITDDPFFIGKDNKYDSSLSNGTIEALRHLTTSKSILPYDICFLNLRGQQEIVGEMIPQEKYLLTLSTYLIVFTESKDKTKLKKRLECCKPPYIFWVISPAKRSRKSNVVSSPQKPAIEKQGKDIL